MFTQKKEFDNIWLGSDSKCYYQAEFAVHRCILSSTHTQTSREC